MARNRVTLSTIAEESGVSPATVSLALRDKPGVGAETRERVREVAKELGYIPKNGAQSSVDLANIGVIIKAEPDQMPQANQFYSYVVAGIEAACRQQQFNLLYARMPVDQDSYPVELPRMLLEQDATDGLLLVGAFLDDTIARFIERQSTPIVLVDAYAASDMYDAVVSDNFGGAHQAVTYLAQRGHRQIGFVGCHPHAYPSIRERKRGYSQALADQGIDQEYVARCHIVDQEEIAEATAELLQENPQITALFGANDEVAVAAMGAAQALGLSVPDEFSVVGFDNVNSAQTATPALTTMHVDKIGMGRLAVQVLINRVEYPESNPVTTTIHPNLVERQSVRRQ